MAFELPLLPLTEPAQQWLAEAYALKLAGKRFAFIDIYAKLYPQLPPDFKPMEMDERLISRDGEQIKVLGVVALQRNFTIVNHINQVMGTIKQLLLDDPTTQTVAIATIAEKTGLSTAAVSLAIQLASDYGHFYRTGSYEENSTQLKSIGIENNVASYSKFIYFPGIEQQIMEVYNRKPSHADDLDIAKNEIKKYLDTAYVNRKINRMTEAINSDTDLAIGTAKEVLETVCNAILQQRNVQPDNNWTLLKLVKTTTNTLDLLPDNATQPDKAGKSIQQLLSGVTNIIQAVAELRNTHGSGHGKAADFQGLEPRYAQLVVGMVIQIALFLLATHGQVVDLVEQEEETDFPL